MSKKSKSETNIYAEAGLETMQCECGKHVPTEFIHGDDDGTHWCPDCLQAAQGECGRELYNLLRIYGERDQKLWDEMRRIALEKYGPFE